VLLQKTINFEQTIGTGAGRPTISRAIENAVREGALAPGERLPTVRDLAGTLRVSPATVASAYRTLRERGVLVTGGRRGTTVAAVPPLPVRRAAPVPVGVVDLGSGNPDPALLPPLGPALAHIDTAHTLYGAAAKLPALVDVARADFHGDGVSGEIGVTGGALDGIERALQARLRAGDAVAVEDPTWPRIQDLVRALGLAIVPVAVDAEGIVPEALAQALRRDVRAVIATPRGHNPTGATLTAGRARELRSLLAGSTGTLVVEDDYVAAISGGEYHALHGTTDAWVVVRSLSKVVGPDLRIALLAGDATTIGRIEGRQLVGPGWVSHLLQRIAVDLLSRRSTQTLFRRASKSYSDRRRGLLDALARNGIEAHGASGLGVWVPVREEAPVVQGLLERGFAVGPGERYRIVSRPGIRVTTTALEPAVARELAAAFAEVLEPGVRTYAG
jgi:DNA-binding transcriptional MocR family regulator